MGRYGSGISVKAACAMDREQIVKALEQKVVCDEDEDGFLYENCSKEEADQKILELYDSITYQLRSANALARAQEKFLIRKMGKRWMQLFETEFFQSGLLEKESLAEFQEEKESAVLE